MRLALFGMFLCVLFHGCDDEEKTAPGSPLPDEGEGEGSPLPAGEGEGEGPTGEGGGEGGEGEGPVCACASDADCQDGNFCNGAEVCNCMCSPGAPPTCADEFECTEDRCVDNQCMNVPSHARCGEGKICRPAEGGCVAPPACRDDAGCVPDDPCQTGVCDAATRACTFAPFDGDEDGHAPRVCGGDDCDDSTDAVNPGQFEECNQKDDNCDGQVDEVFDLLANTSHCGACNHACGRGEICLNGSCQCPEGRFSCDMRGCTDIQSDNNNCGDCGHECPRGANCVNGECACPNGTADCGWNECVDILEDQWNCGRCRNECGGLERCIEGTCQCGDDLGGTSCDDRCVDLQWDNTDCGECGRRCPDVTACTEGECRCPGDGETVCQDICTLLEEDLQNCGRCGNECQPSFVCVNGACRCPEGWEPCGNACFSPLDDPWNCGRCGNACDAGLICRNGSCECPEEGSVVCPGIGCTDIANDAHCGSCDNTCPDFAIQNHGRRQVACRDGLCQCFEFDDFIGVTCDDQTCTDLDWDWQNCGECENRCVRGEECREGGCVCALQGFETCEGGCTNLSEDPENCGECGHRCAIGEGCTEYRCWPCADFNNERCGGDYCVSLNFADDHCGQCNNACANNEVCSWTRCVIPW